MAPTEIQKIFKAGKIASQVREYAKTIIKKDKLLLEIAEQIENKIIELGGKPAFPTNLSINEIAAHYTPSYDDKTLARGLLKVDFGVHIDGWIADTAFSIDLEGNEKNKKLIKASEDALEKAIELVKEKIEVKKVNDKNISSNDKLINKKRGDKVKGDELINNKIRLGEQLQDVASKTRVELGEGLTTSEIGKIIQQTIESQGFSPIVNLSGHSMEKYDLHSGITIPNINEKRTIEIKSGLYAIEPFATNGNGKIQDGKPSGIYIINQTKNVRSQLAREILDFIAEEYKTIPFCSRWLVNKFGTKSLFAIRELENNNIISQFDQLVEISKKPVSQAEHTILIDKDKVTVTTL